MEDVSGKEYEDVSKKELMPNLLLSLMKDANVCLAKGAHDSSYYKVYRAHIQQMFIVLSEDVGRLDDKARKGFVLPDEGTGPATVSKWQELQMSLWNLARRCGHVGMSEKKLDFKELLETLEKGVISSG